MVFLLHKEKKQIFVLFFFTDVCLVTTVKPETVSVYQVKKTEKDTYKKRTNWRLKDLRLIDGRDETNVRTSKKILTSSNDSQQDLCFIICYNLTHHCYRILNRGILYAQWNLFDTDIKVPELSIHGVSTEVSVLWRKR